MQWGKQNLNSGLLSKTIEKARDIDMSALDSSLTLSVYIQQRKIKLMNIYIDSVTIKNTEN